MFSPEAKDGVHLERICLVVPGIVLSDCNERCQNTVYTDSTWASQPVPYSVNFYDKQSVENLKGLLFVLLERNC